MPKVSVVIPTYNRAAMMCDCVARVLASDYPDFEVIVVDDCSPDDTQACFAARFGGDERVCYLRNETNLHVSATRNRGAAAARGDYVLFVDDDNLVEPDMISQLVHGLTLDPELAQIAPLAVHQAQGLVWTLGATFNLWTSMPINLHEKEPIEHVQLEDRLYPTWYSPNAWMVRKTVFDALGGFDPFWQIMFDESDFGMRLRRAGYKSAIYPMARTWHLGYLEPGKAPALRCLGIESPRRAFCFARNRSVFVKRHFPFWGKVTVLLVFVPLFAVYYCGVAIKNRRLDIAWAFLKGSIRGLFCSR